MKIRHSNTRVAKLFQEGVDDPLAFLEPWEQRAAEIYVTLGLDPLTRAAKDGVVVDVFKNALKEELGIVAAGTRSRLHSNAAWKAYVRSLREDTRKGVLDKLHRDAYAAYGTYKWARETAVKENDYKEARLAAADHLDRIGATEKPPEVVQQVATIIVRSRNVDVAEPLRALPEVEVEEESDATTS